MERIDFRPRVPRPQFAAPRLRNANHAAGARKRKQQRDTQEQACRETANMLSTRACCFLVTHSRSRAGTALCRGAAPCSNVADLTSLASHRLMGQHRLLQLMSRVGPSLISSAPGLHVDISTMRAQTGVLSGRLAAPSLAVMRPTSSLRFVLRTNRRSFAGPTQGPGAQLESIFPAFPHFTSAPRGLANDILFLRWSKGPFILSSIKGGQKGAERDATREGPRHGRRKPCYE